MPSPATCAAASRSATASRSGVALLSAAELKPDAVILDIEMPLQDGFSVTRQLKTLPSPPVVILLSIHGDPLSRQRGAEAGSDGFIEKSGDWTRLIPELRRALALKRFAK